MTQIKTFETLSGADFIKFTGEQISALSKDENVRLTFRIRAIVAAIATYIKATETRAILTQSDAEVTHQVLASCSRVELERLIEATKARAIFDIQTEAEVMDMTPQQIAALSKDELEELTLRSQDVLNRCPIKPGCR
jgi:hypothetical protein